MGHHFFEAITDISSDAESREEQNGASHFVIGVTTDKLWPLGRRMISFVILSLPEDG